MQNLSLLCSRGWRSALCSIAVALAAFVALPHIASAQRDSGASCAEIFEQSIECVKGPNGAASFQWCFSFRNRTNFTITEVRTPNGAVNVQPVQPNGTGRGCLTLYGTLGATITVTLSFCHTVVVHDSVRTPNGGWVDSGGTRLECCEQSVSLRLPTCGSDSTKNCVEMLGQNVQCQTGANGATSYQWCINFRNHTNSTITQVRVGNSVINLQPVQPNAIGQACLTLYGNPGVTTVTVIFCHVEYIRDTVKGPNGGTIDTTTTRMDCCEQRVEVRLPECGQGDCIRITQQEAYCDSTKPGAYIWCFTFTNTTTYPINTIYVGNTAVNVGAVYPGQTRSACVQLTGVPGPTVIRLRACSMQDSVFNEGGIPDSVFGQHCCDLQIETRLPECEPVHRDCCDGFIINFANANPVAAPNGLTGLLGLIGAGPNPIAKVSATVVTASVNGQPAFAYFNSGTILNPLGAGVVTPPPYGQELIWNSAAGVPMNAPSIFLNWLRLPPMAPNARRDTVSFCIRWRFTDVNCKSCDTLICYRVVRNQFFFNLGLRTEREKGASVLGGSGSIAGNLKGQNAGTLAISFPELPADEFGQVVFKGLKIQADQNVRINAVTADNLSANFSVEHGLATGSFNAVPGNQISLNINYDNLNGQPALNHFLLVSYESSLLPGVEQQMPLSVTLRQEGIATGGDQIEAVAVEVPSKEHVQTFALHLRNNNTTAEPLSGLHIVAGDGVKLLAVGPTSSETEALLRFGAEGEGGRPYISEAAEGTVALAPGAERNPIYVTVSINEEADPIISFTTLNSLDGVVSQGELNLAQISSTEEEGGLTGTSISLGQSAPNPTTGEVSISLHLAKTERVTLVVRDISGREVLRLLENEQLNSGTHVVTGNVSGLPSGTYFYTLESASGHETRKMTIAK